MERLNERCCERVGDEWLALLHITGTEQSRLALQRAALRIRRNVRYSDSVLVLNSSCVVVLPGTSFAGAQAAARRIATLLVDIEYELRVLCGTAARTLLHRMQSEQATVVVNVVEEPVGAGVQASLATTWQTPETSLLPYLAFLASYPSHRLFYLFPYELACRYRCAPVGAERGVLTLATCQQLDHEIVAHFREMTQRDIFLVRCEATMIDDILSYWQRVILI